MKEANPRSAFLLLTCAAALLIGAEARALEFSWSLYARGEEPSAPPRGTRLQCGDYGVFHIAATGDTGGFAALPGGVSVGGTVGPPAAVSGREVPLPYPAVEDGDTAGFSEGRALPCDGGACFGEPGGRDGRAPWVAVLDWDNWHGWTVGETLGEVAGPAVETALFPLDDPAFTAAFGAGATDLHVLAQLCAIAEAVDARHLRPPLVINMSFGRLATAGDARDGACEARSLSCQVGRVVDHLIKPREGTWTERRTAVVAAAGNHRKLLFPAAYGSVLATGALDVAAFGVGGWILPSWETPAERVAPDALFPGSGLCLAGDGGTPWPAPPGSSYSGAFFAGWLAGTLVEVALDGVLAGGTWAPGWSCFGSACSPVLRQGRRVYRTSTNARAGALLERSLGGACGGSELEGVAVEARLGTAGTMPPVPSVSLAEMTVSAVRPTPEPHLCIPCSAIRRPPSDDDLAAFGAIATGSESRGGGAADDLVLDLSTSRPLTDDMVLVGLYLRVGEQFHPLELLGASLADVSAGTFDHLVLTGLGALLPEDRQASLIYVLRLHDTLDPEPFWTSSPVVVRAGSPGTER